MAETAGDHTGAIRDDHATSVPVAGFVSGSQRATDTVDVRISLGIIRRFSEGLYSSPNKTFEELVSNSYDAGAKRVWIYLPPDLTSDDASIIVVDDGVSMDVDGLRELWMIGESRKRERAPVGGRPPIGKFGIGKLATYVLANELTYLVCHDGAYRAITMDYARVEGAMTDPQELRLAVASLEQNEARGTLLTATRSMVAETPTVIDQLFGPTRERSWTAAILTSLKGPAHGIERGRLRWVLRTAIPLNPDFRLFENDVELPSSKLTVEPIWTFVCGRDEGQLPADDRVGEPRFADESAGEQPAYVLPKAGVVAGEAKLFPDPLERGKSGELGRSHGVFVRVRGRLINLDDPEFNLGPELHHGTLTRLNMVVNANDLDPLIASPRESIQDSPALRELKAYLLAIFNRARAELAANDSTDIPALISKQGRIAAPPAALTQGPLRRMVRRAVAGEKGLQVVLGLEEGNLDAAQILVQAGDDLLENVFVEPSGDGRLVRFDPQRRAAVLNSEHPFVGNYINVKGAAEPLRLLGLTELLTQAYMLDEDVSPDQVERVMARRDLFLRELVKRYPRSSSLVAQELRDAGNDEKALEDAVADALALLGFSVQRVSGTGDTDGIAIARLGRRTAGQESYALTYDAKSSGRAAAESLGIGPDEVRTIAGPKRKRPKSARIKAATAQTSILKVHRERAREAHNLDITPEFTVLVAPGFQGDGVEGALIHEVCKSDGITPITVADLARLVELFPIRAVTPAVIKKLLTESRSPETSRAFVDAIAEDDGLPATPPVGELLSVLLDYSLRKSAVTVETLATALYERSDGKYDIDLETLDSLVRGLAALAPRGMYFDGRIVALNAEPNVLLDELHEALDRYAEGLGAPFMRELESATVRSGNNRDAAVGPVAQRVHRGRRGSPQ